MKEKAKFIRSDRRSFLKGAAVASGAAVVTPTTATASAVPVAEVPADKLNKGYEENDYIRNYYDHARF